MFTSYGRKDKAYHADNLRFNDSKFKGSCIKGGQKIAYFGVGAHHQNGITEARIKEVSYGSRTLLLYAIHKCPGLIYTVLWPYTLQAVVDSHTILSLDENGLGPLEKLLDTEE